MHKRGLRWNSHVLNERKSWSAKKEEDVMYVDGDRAMATVSI